MQTMHSFLVVQIFHSRGNAFFSSSNGDWCVLTPWISQNIHKKDMSNDALRKLDQSHHYTHNWTQPSFQTWRPTTKRWTTQHSNCLQMQSTLNEIDQKVSVTNNALESGIIMLDNCVNIVRDILECRCHYCIGKWKKY